MVTVLYFFIEKKRASLKSFHDFWDTLFTVFDSQAIQTSENALDPLTLVPHLLVGLPLALFCCFG